MREWNKQWGRIGKEGNLWWLGSNRANWEMVMGKAKLGWFRAPLFPASNSALRSLTHRRLCSAYPSTAYSRRRPALRAESALQPRGILAAALRVARRASLNLPHTHGSLLSYYRNCRLVHTPCLAL